MSYTITLDYTQDVLYIPVADVPLGFIGTPPDAVLRFATIDVIYGELDQLSMSLKVLGTQAGDLGVGSAIISNLTNTSNLAVGQPVSATGIPAGARILSITSPTSVFISKNATAVGVGTPVSFYGDRTICSGGQIKRSIVLETTAAGTAIWTAATPAFTQTLLKSATSNLYNGKMASAFPGNVKAVNPVVT